VCIFRVGVLRWTADNISVLLQDSVTLCTLGMGTAFGESILNDSPRHSTVVTREYCELLRVEQKDFKILWEVGDPTQFAEVDLRNRVAHHRGFNRAGSRRV